jgi:hypothetical protein
VCPLLTPAGRDEMNIKKAEPNTNSFIAPPIFVGGTIPKRF